MSAGRRTSTWLAGRKACTPMLTSRPPLILRGTGPRTTSPSLHTAMTFSHSLAPLLRPPGLAVGQDDAPVLVLDGLEQHADLVAGEGRHDRAAALVVPLAQVDGALTLVPDVHPDGVGGHLADAAGHELVVLKR